MFVLGGVRERGGCVCWVGLGRGESVCWVELRWGDGGEGLKGFSGGERGGCVCVVAVF